MLLEYSPATCFRRLRKTAGLFGISSLFVFKTRSHCVAQASLALHSFPGARIACAPLPNSLCRLRDLSLTF